MRIFTRREVRQFVQQLEQRGGWVMIGFCGTGQIKMRHASGEVVIVPNSPRGGRSLKNKLAEVKRIERGIRISGGG